MNKSITFSLLFLLCLTVQLNGQENDAYDKALSYFKHYQFHKVISLYEANEPDQAASWNLLAKSYQQLGQLNHAETCYLKAIDMDSTDLIIKNELARLYVQTNNDQEALILYDEIIKQESDNPYYWKKMAQLLFRLQRPIEAIGAYQKATQLNPRDAESNLAMAKLFVEINELNAADSIIKQQLLRQGDHTNFLKLKLQIDYRQKNFGMLIKTAEQIFETGDSSLLTKKLSGIAYYRIGKEEKAIDLLSSIVDQVDNNELIHFYLGLANRAEKQHLKATYHFEQAIEKGVSENISSYYTQLGANFEEMGDLKQSIQAYKIAYESSKNKVLLYHLARSYDQYYKDKKVALNYYEKYLSFNDTANLLYYNYSINRIREIRKLRHFDLDTIN